jgi:hypothetical protein
LVDRGLLSPDAKASDDWYRITCPWIHEHTDGDETGTYVRFNVDGTTAFHCFHSHGDKFRTTQFREWVRDNGGPNVVSTAVFTWEDPDLVLLAPERGPLPDPPLEVLAPDWREWVEKTSAGAGVPPAFVLLGLLAAVAAVGSAGVEIQIGDTWSEPLVLWLMMVASPSAGKSPALTASRRLLARVVAKLKHQNLDNDIQHSSELLRYELAKAAYKKAQKDKKPLPSLPPKPEKPPFLQLVVGNTTVEALAAALKANPRGVLAIHDEMSSLLLNLNRYSGGNDRPLYLEAWAAAPWIINRRHLEKPIEISRSAVSMFRGMQPEKLREFLDSEADDGLAARFLSAWPDPPHRIPLPERRRGDDEWADTAIERIWEIAGTPNKPLVLSLDPRAFDPIDARLVGMTRKEEGFMAGFTGKGRGTIARLAGALTLLEWAATASTAPPTTVSDSALAGAIRLWEEFFQPHARAIFRVGRRSTRELRLRKVAVYLRDKQLRTFRRETIRVRALGRTLDAPDVDPILRDLEQRGLIRPLRRVNSGPGRPPAEWEVNPRIFE